MKNCCNCKHRDKCITEEPCFSCKYTENWELMDGDDWELMEDDDL